jgi:hypothetical protein
MTQQHQQNHATWECKYHVVLTSFRFLVKRPRCARCFLPPRFRAAPTHNRQPFQTAPVIPVALAGGATHLDRSLFDYYSGVPRHLPL